jgi:dipeptidyl aminopeptidase/acylaminoacyl peptidase
MDKRLNKGVFMNKRSYLLLTVILLNCNLIAEVNRRQVGNVVMEEIPKIPAATAERMRDYQNTRSAFLCGWHPTGDGIFIQTRFGRTSQIHFVKSPKALRKQITFFDEPVSNVTICPNADADVPSLLFTKDIGGDEYFQIYSQSLLDGNRKLVTDGKSLNNLPVWSTDGNRFAYYSTRRNGKDWDVYLSTLSNPKEAQCIVAKGGYWYPLDFSPDGRKLLVKKHVSVNESSLHIYDIPTQKMIQFNMSEIPIAYGSARFAANSRDIYLTCNQAGDFMDLYLYSTEDRSMQNLTAEVHWDVSDFSISFNRQKLAFTLNENGMSKLRLLDTKTNQSASVADIPTGQVSRLHFHPYKPRLAFTLNASVHPADVYEYDVNSQKLNRWTDSELGGLNPDSFVQPEAVFIPTFDTAAGKPRKIPGFLYKPKTKGPWPVLINIHGGPESQYKPRFSFRTQYWVNELQIAVLSPNVRGSTGYGKEYVNLDNGYKREDSVQDIGAILDWIDKQDQLDPSRTGVFGVSYGGYMVLASMIHYADRIKCGIDVVGISNFVSFLENTEDHRRDRRRVEYGDERDPKMREFLLKISPTANAHKITKPILIAQGFNDPRVPATESEQMVKEIRKNGQSVWYFLAKDEGHIFRKKNNSDLFYNTVSLFLEKHLLKTE